MRFDAIILAAGKSLRMAGHDKLLLPFGGEFLISRTVRAFFNLEKIEKIIVVTDSEAVKAALSCFQSLIFVGGGETRTDSVKNGLAASTAEGVLIHDGARPFVSRELIMRVIEGVEKNGSAVPSLPMKNSVRRVENGKITEYINRENLEIVQTPQGFIRENLLLAYKKAGSSAYTDDSEVYGLCYPVFTVLGTQSNRKITVPEDALSENGRAYIGFDKHRLEEGRKLILGGVHIPFEKGCVAHSDGDALVHSIIDALLSVVDGRDIGQHFPDSDPRYKDISSLVLLRRVKALLDERAMQINSVSSVILLEKPKLASFIPEMYENLSLCLNIPSEKIHISAKTGEGSGEVGESRAVECYTVASLG